MAETSRLETTASEVCTRSGAFALLLSLALASLIPVWSHRKESMILGRYVGLRLNLVAALDALDENPLWKRYKLTHETESVPIEQLVDLSISSAKLAPPNNVTPINLPPMKQGATGPVPAAPTGIGIEVTFGEARQIANFLSQLNDSDMLTRSRNASDFFNFSIYRWIMKRDNLIAQSVFASASHGVMVPTDPDPRSPANFAPARDKHALLGLTLGEVRELAKVELPTISNAVKLGRDESEVELTTSSLPRSLYGASLFAHVLLFFIIVYFGAFTREAISAAHFPSQGTLFGVFAGSRSTLAVFFLALWTPLAASIGIFLVSYGATSRWGTLGLALCSALISLVVTSVFAVFNSKSYFHPLLKRSAATN